ncbi:MAG: 3-phosphoshikimate 1-carboxyvinyltransferase [Gammaproteobacteria bacterium]|nr:3-phosphoshikimate 1-carboxyvinyltransferase [Gammaproteobacteria bacterium]
MENTHFQLAPQGRCTGQLDPPGDKSISHRAIMLASLAQGTSEIRGLLPSGDCLATLEAFRNMGVQVHWLAPDRLRVHGAGLHGLQAPDGTLDMGNSGTAMRLLAGILCAQAFASTLSGDASLNARAMQRIADPLQAMGADITLSSAGTAPLEIRPCGTLDAIDYVLPMASAQVKSCLLLAGLYAKGRTCITEPVRCRDHTENMLRTFSCAIEREDHRVCLQGGGELAATEIDIPGDLSSAAFFIVGTLISQDSHLTVKNVGINPTRTGALEILRQMGAKIDIRNERNYGEEPVADLVVTSSSLHGIDIPQNLVVDAIDEFPILFIAAACATGTTQLGGAEELRTKESDRIHTMVSGLQTLGIRAEERPDGVTITGGEFGAGTVHSGGDHRVAMAFAMASLAASGTITVENTGSVATSFPGFVESATQLGLLFE